MFSNLHLSRRVKDQVKTYIAEHFEIEPESLYFTHPTFFSRLENKPAQNVHDEYWHVHVDKETYQTFHYTSLLYLTDMGEDFKVSTLCSKNFSATSASNPGLIEWKLALSYINAYSIC